MPNRILKESINESKSLSFCSSFAQDLFRRLITYADDYGRFNADTQIILARLYPRELGVLDEYDICGGLIELVGIGKVKFYTTSLKPDSVFGYLQGWGEHQRVRNSKKKLPDPEKEEINDWYLKRFVPTEVKTALFERDKFQCQACRRDYSIPGFTARQQMRMLQGVMHIDHIVPVSHGGGATMENLRVICAGCNLSRKRALAFLDVLREARGEPAEQPQLAATRGELPPNPIQSNPNPNPNPNPRAQKNERSESNENVRAFISAYCDAFRDRYNTTPDITGKDAGIAKRVVKDLGTSRAIALAHTYLSMTDGFYLTKRHDLVTFESNLKAIAVKLDTGQSFNRVQSRQQEVRDANVDAVRTYLESKRAL